MNDTTNMMATPSMADKPSPDEKLHGRRRLQLVLPFMMPGHRHVNRATKMESKGEHVFFLDHGVGHCSHTYKVMTEAGTTTYASHCTWG